MSILIKAGEVRLKLKNGHTIRRPMSHGIIHDESGRSLPRCVVFLGPFKKTRQRADMDGADKAYFGRRYEGRVADLSALQSELAKPESSWKTVGEVVTIWYKRDGEHANRYFHNFKAPVTLSRSGKFMKLSLQNGCTYNWRGFVYP